MVGRPLVVGCSTGLFYEELRSTSTRYYLEHGPPSGGTIDLSLGLETKKNKGTKNVIIF